MTRFCAFVFFLLVSVQRASGQWPAVARGPQNFPNIEVALAPPSNPLPQVSAFIGDLEHSREEFEAKQMNAITIAFNRELTDARARISDTVGKAMSAFDGSHLSSPSGPGHSGLSFAVMDGKDDIDTLTLKVNVRAVPAADLSIRDTVGTIEHKRADQEKLMFERSKSEMRGLTDIVLSELEAQLRFQVDACLGRLKGKGHGFFGAKPHEANVRVRTPELTFPTVTTLAQDMEKRRDTSESLAAARIMELELKLLRAENEMIKDALRASVARILH